MTVFIAGFPLYEFDVAATDFLLCIESLVFGYLLYKQPGKHTLLRIFFAALFLSLSISSLFGSFFHAFFPAKTATWGGFFVWMLVGLSTGTTAEIIWCISALLSRGKKFLRSLLPVLFFSFIFFLYIFIAINHQFFVIILFYFPALLGLSAIAVRKIALRKDVAWKYLLSSMLLSYIAALVQIMHINIHPVYFNFNALYHTIQAVALILLFFSFRLLLKRKIL